MPRRFSPHSYSEQTFDLHGLDGISDARLSEHLALYAGYVKQVNLLNEELAAMIGRGQAPSGGCWKAMTIVSPAESAGRGSSVWGLARFLILPVLAFAPALAWAPARAPGVSVERPRPPVVSTLLAVPTFAPIYFGAGMTDIRPSQKKVLDDHALWLRSDGTRRLLVEGHTDGPADHLRSVEIGEQRARAAKAYLIAKGAAADHIAFVSRGGGQPSCTERTAACRAENRRVTFSTRSH